MKNHNCEGCPYRDKPYVPPSGPREAKIVVIGEAPGENEERNGEVFIGRAGTFFNMILKGVGIDRKDLYITNVLKCRPDNNKIASSKARDALEHCLKNLAKELASLSPMVIVPMGNIALNAVNIRYRIGKARGYVMVNEWGKIIPTWHPSYIARGNWQEYQTALYDWRKILKHSKKRMLQETPEFFTIEPNIMDVEIFVDRILQEAQKTQVEIALDLETYICDSIMETPIKLCGIATTERTALVIPFITENDSYYWRTQDETVRALAAIGRLLECPRLTIITHNSLFDILVLMNHGFEVRAKMYDTMIGHYCVYHPAAMSLAYLVSVYADYPPWKLEKHQGDEGARTYNARDCVVLLMIKPLLDLDIDDNHVGDVFKRMMANVVPTCRMTINGVNLNRERQATTVVQMTADVEKMRQGLEKMGGIPGLNPNSIPQLREILFKKMKLKSQVKTPEGQLSTNEDVLKRLSLRYPENAFIDALLAYRGMAKLVSTYSNPPVLGDGRVHSQFRMTVVTGRLASSNPNMMNLPSGRKGESQKYIRKMYTPDSGNKYIEVDFSQVELMVFAIITNDEPWLQAFKEGKDIHALNLISLIGRYEEKYRTFVKNFIYGIIFGSAGGEIKKVAPKELLAVLSIDVMLQRLLNDHPAVADFRELQRDNIESKHKVVSPFGRIRWFTGKATEANVREGMNFPIQSTVGDVMHEKMAIVDDELSWPVDRIILQLHDALYIETPERRVPLVADKLVDIMERPVYAPSGHVFNLKVDVKVGSSLGEMEDYTLGRATTGS